MDRDPNPAPWTANPSLEWEISELTRRHPELAEYFETQRAALIPTPRPKFHLFPASVRQLSKERHAKPLHDPSYRESYLFNFSEVPWLIRRIARHWWDCLPNWIAVPLMVVGGWVGIAACVWALWAVWQVLTFPWRNAMAWTEPGMPLAFLRYTEDFSPLYLTPNEVYSTHVNVFLAFWFVILATIGMGVAAWVIRRKRRAPDM